MPANFNIPENITRLKPYVPGKPVEELERELGLTNVIKLASNESPLGPSPRVVQTIRETAENVFYYPEGSAPLLREAVAKHLDVDLNLLVFGNGSDEILLLLCQVLIGSADDEIVMGDPSFAMYDIYSTLVGAKSVKVPLDSSYTHDLNSMADRITENTRIVFIANPNNPTGTLVTQRQVEKFMERVPETVTVVFDEAYYEFVTHPERPNTIPYVLEGRNVVVTRTFSKAYALAGLRLGYAIAPRELASYLDRARSPFNANLIAQAAGRVAIGDTEHLAKSVELNTSGKKQLEDGAAKLGLQYVPSEANFVLIHVGGDGRDGVAVYNALLRKGVIVRPCKGFGLPNHIRVSIGTEAQIKRFLQALEDVLLS